MKIVIIGAGAMGCLYGAFLSRKHEVVLLDSFLPQVEAINKNGITVRELDGSENHFMNVKAFPSGAYREATDLVILFVKSIYTEDALEGNKDLFAWNPTVMTLQNGAGNDRKIAKYVDMENVIIGTSKHSALNVGNGAVRHNGAGVTMIGSNHSAERQLNSVYEMLSGCGFACEISDDIQRIIWEKLFVNLSINVFTAITRTPIGYMIQNENAWKFAKRLVYEAIEVAEEDGTYFDRREVLTMLRKVCVDSGAGYSSMYQDMKRGVKTEIDAINGAIVEQAKLYGVPVPYNTLMVDLIHAMEGSYDIRG